MGLQDELVGTFELVALESRRSDGEITHPYGDHPIGMFMFDSAGRYSIQLTDPDRTPDQGNYLAMFGTYVVADDLRAFILTPRGAADPKLIGTGDVTTYITWRRDSSGRRHLPTKRQGPEVPCGRGVRRACGATRLSRRT